MAQSVLMAHLDTVDAAVTQAQTEQLDQTADLDTVDAAVTLVPVAIQD
jgi:hypothetical protein